jgi:hypothetical protein
MAKFLYSFLAGPVRDFWVKNFGSKYHFLIMGLSGSSYFLFIIFIFHLGSFRPLQPKEIEVQPIINFLNRDEHMRWRFLTLGFGDQMAWLSSNTLAATVDGNYHSARRLPELTTRPVERLENAKFNGEAGLASLNDFLTNSEKYSLKYVFSNDRYYDPLLFYSGWSRTIQLENGIMVWEKGNISTIKPVVPKKLHPALKIAWGIFPVMSLVVACLLTLFYLKRYKNKDYFDTVPETDHNYPLFVIYSSSLMPLILFSGFLLFQLNELLFLNEQKDPKTTVLNFYNHLDFQRFETAFGFFKTSPTYTLDQYLLEKSVNDGGLLPSYAKLDSIAVNPLKSGETSSSVIVNTFWRTSMGELAEIDTLHLSKEKNKWYIIPKSVIPEIPPYQMRSYSFTLYKKQGKRMISSFPTIKDDRVKKPFAAFEKANLITTDNEMYITGKLINADDIPINVAIKAVIEGDSGKLYTFYPGKEFQYNLWPKASTYFQISLRGFDSLQINDIKKINLYAETDVSESGYIHGGSLGYKTEFSSEEKDKLLFTIFNELSVDITIPGVLIAEQDPDGIIRKVELVTHRKAVRSGLNIEFSKEFIKAQKTSKVIENIPMQLYINGTTRNKVNLEKTKSQLVVLPHCFISQAIYLQ